MKKVKEEDLKTEGSVNVIKEFFLTNPKAEIVYISESGKMSSDKSEILKECKGKGYFSIERKFIIK